MESIYIIISDSSKNLVNGGRIIADKVAVACLDSLIKSYDEK